MKYKAQPKQLLFHYAQADEVLYGGSAGGGKSYAIIWDAVDFCMSNKKVRAAIFRRTYPELEKSIIYDFIANVPSKLYKYNKQEHRVTFLESESTLEFNHCQHKEDVVKFQSAQYQRLYFDELTHFSKQIYVYLLSRLRSPADGTIKTQVKSASNPGGIGHNWVKDRFIDKSIPNQVTTKTEPDGGAVYTTQFIPARVYDNLILMKNDANYVNTLMRLPEDERKALLEGDWDGLKGQFFKEWRTDLHVIEPFEIPKEWTKFRAMDWGYRNPSCVVWCAIDNDSRMYIYKELYVTEKTIKELADAIIDRTGNDKISYTVADPACWSMNQYEHGESIALKLNEYGVSMTKADNNRISGASAFHNYLRPSDVDGKPMLQFFNTCHHCIVDIPSLIHDDRKPEDVDTQGDDHDYDAVRYAIMSHPLTQKPTKQYITKTNTFDYYLKKSQEAKRRQGYVGNL